MNTKELFNKYTKEEDYGCQTCGCTCDCGYTARYMNEEQFTQAIAEIISNPAEPLVMPTLTGDLENDLQIIYQNGKPHGIRDRSGYLLFFTHITHYTGQEKRYQEEVEQQNKLADYLLHQLSKCSA